MNLLEVIKMILIKMMMKETLNIKEQLDLTNEDDMEMIAESSGDYTTTYNMILNLKNKFKELPLSTFITEAEFDFLKALLYGTAHEGLMEMLSV
jgi:hypothetical protein